MLAKENIVNGSSQDRRIEIIQGIAQQVALAIQNDIYKKEMVETERMEREFQLARESQKTFLPDHLPKIENWELEAYWQPARHVGGDLYDLIKLGKDSFALVIADVSDKGMSAALYMTVTRTLIRAFANNSKSPAKILEMVNNNLLPDTQNGMFVTAIIAILTPSTGKLVYSNAGHNLPLLLRAQDGEVEKLPKGGIALGVLKNIHLLEHTYNLLPGDTLLLYTDGVTEAFSSSGEVFGDERLINLFISMQNKSVKDIVITLDNTITEFRNGMAPSDDLTVLCIKQNNIITT